MKALQSKNSSITEDPHLEEHEEFKGNISIVHDDHNCSIKGCNLDHNTLAFFLSLNTERSNCKEGYQDPKDDPNEENRHNKEGNIHLQSLIDTDTDIDQLSNCGSISCRSSSMRSFTFPVLWSESPESPVRMVKADRRHRRRWRTCFICFKCRV